jgi:hypothetical protein
VSYPYPSKDTALMAIVSAWVEVFSRQNLGRFLSEISGTYSGKRRISAGFPGAGRASARRSSKVN